MRTLVLFVSLFVSACGADDEPTADAAPAADAELLVDAGELELDAGPALPSCGDVADQCATAQWFCQPCDQGGVCSCNGQPELACELDCGGV
jgi:hypothetical protein